MKQKKNMKMNKEMNENRVGIYAQESADLFTAAGDGLALNNAKSPVIETKNSKIDEPIESEEINKSEKEDREGDVKSSNNSQIDFVRGPERDKLNKATKLEAFPHCEEYYGKERWDKALQILQNLGYVNWEINTMFKALNSIPKKVPKRKSINNEAQHEKDMIKKPRLDDFSKEEVKLPQGVISGILLKEKYSTYDLRANIGDASHPNFHILPENKTKMYLEFYKFLRQEECFQDDPIVCSCFVNQTFMIECKNLQILEQVDKKICRLNTRLWPGADLVMIPRSSERKNIKICVPYSSYSDEAEILQIIGKQNRLPVEKWKVNKTEKWEDVDGICLDVEVDGGSYLRLIHDQDDVFFLMKKAIIKLPQDDQSKNSVEQNIQDAKL